MRYNEQMMIIFLALMWEDSKKVEIPNEVQRTNDDNFSSVDVRR